jgi:hypothetical protein
MLTIVNLVIVSLINDVRDRLARSNKGRRIIGGFGASDNQTGNCWVVGICVIFLFCPSVLDVFGINFRILL